jgi:tetrahydromethanopterin S-methyltransferase subunit C
VRDNPYGWGMAAALLGALVAGYFRVPLWAYLVGLMLVLALIGLVVNRKGEL